MTKGASNTPATTIPWEEWSGAPMPQLRENIDGLFQGIVQSFRQRLVQHQAELKQRDEEIARLQLEIRLREEQLRLARIEKYGPKGEKLGDISGATAKVLAALAEQAKG